MTGRLSMKKWKKHGRKQSWSLSRYYLTICRTAKTVCQDDLPQERPKHIMKILWLRQDWSAAVGYGRKRYKSRPRILTKQWSTLHSKKRSKCQKTIWYRPFLANLRGPQIVKKYGILWKSKIHHRVPRHDDFPCPKPDEYSPQHLILLH
jgi:hypothetical protein